MARASNIAPNRHVVHPFDVKYGTDTAWYLSPDELRSDGSGHAARSQTSNNGYSAVAPSVFREACRRWRETLSLSAAQVAAYTVVDVGAGKGRALLLAAEIPFRKVIGVELHEELARIAQNNITQYNVAHRKRIARPRAKVRVVRQDAMEFRWPRPPLLVFLNNPFECALVEQLGATLATVAARGPNLVDVLYVNPGCADTLIRQGNFKLLWDAQIQMDEPDQKADPYGAIADRVAVFRYSPDGRRMGK
jgi:SAM-dependent methyltransferase